MVVKDEILETPMVLTLEEAASLYVEKLLLYHDYGGINNYLLTYNDDVYVLRDFDTRKPFYELLPKPGE